MYKFNPKNFPYKGVDVKSLPLNYQLAIIDERRRHAQFHRQAILEQRKAQHDAEVAKRRALAAHQYKLWYARNMIGRAPINFRESNTTQWYKKEVFRCYKNARDRLQWYNEEKRRGNYYYAKEAYAEYEGWKLQAERRKRHYNYLCDRLHSPQDKMY